MINIFNKIKKVPEGLMGDHETGGGLERPRRDATLQTSLKPENK